MKTVLTEGIEAHLKNVTVTVTVENQPIGSCPGQCMTKSVELPQDIIDNVIAAGGDDTDFLKQCSLVSSSFLHPSRKHLFSRITLGSDETCQGIHQFLIQNPVVQTFVRAITLTESMPNWRMTPEWINGTPLLAILQLPFCCLECFSIVLREDDEQAMTFWLTEDVPPDVWDWNDFSSEMKDALSNIILSSTLKTICLNGIINVPTTFFSRITHLTTLELHSLTPDDFCDENSSTRAASRRVARMASHTVIDRCLWRYREEHVHR